MTREELLATTFAELADTLDDDFQVLDLLQTLADRSTEILGASLGAASLVDLRGSLHVVASTTHAVEVRNLIEIAASRELGAEAFTSGRSIVNVPHAIVARRWPEFAVAAEPLGYQSPQAVPLRLRGEVLGVLTVVFRTATEMTHTDVTILESLARVATIGLLRERTPRQKELLAEQLRASSQLRIVVEQAKGVVAELLGIDAACGFDIIKAYANRENRPVSDVAVAVLEGHLDPRELHGRT